MIYLTCLFQSLNTLTVRKVFYSVLFFVWVFVHWRLNSTKLTKELSQQLCVHMFLYLWMHFKMFLWVMRCLVLDFQFFICFLICSPFPSDNVSMFYLISVNLLFPWPVVHISEDIWNNFLTSFWLPLESYSLGSLGYIVKRDPCIDQ